MPRTAYREAWTPFGGGINFLADADGKDEINFSISLQSRYGRSMSRIDRRRTVWAQYAFPAMADGYFLLKGDEFLSDLMMVEDQQ